jgi:uroporphyrinogen decarboxylase
VNSRERVVTALNHQEPDRVPVNFGGVHTSIHHVGHRRLLEYLGMDVYDAPIIDMFQMIVDPSPALRAKFHDDVQSLFTNPGTGWHLKVNPADDTWTDEWGVSYRRPAGGFWYDFTSHPLKEGTIEELEKYRWPDPRDPNRVKGLAEKARHLYETTDKALLIQAASGGVYEHSYWIRGVEELYIDMASNLKYVEALAEKIVQWMLEFWDHVLTAVGPYVQVVQIGDDLGAQNGPLFSPEIYRKIYKPRHRRLTDLIRKKTNARIYFHSCGSIYTILPDMIESGIEIINPLQVSAKNMDSAKFKKEFGKDLSVWGGGANPQTVMTLGTPAEVKLEVKRRIHDLAPEGGLVFASVHNIQPNVPPENVVAFFEAAHEYGGYPICV